MGAKATAVPFGGNSKNLGTFHSKKFNIFEEDQMELYAELRTQANDASSGITIEQIREYSRKTTTHEGQGPEAIATSVEDIYLVVQYWEKKPKRKTGDSEDETTEAKRSWSKERSVG